MLVLFQFQFSILLYSFISGKEMTVSAVIRFCIDQIVYSDGSVTALRPLPAVS